MLACKAADDFLFRNGEAVAAPIMPNNKPRSGEGCAEGTDVFGIEGSASVNRKNIKVTAKPWLPRSCRTKFHASKSPLFDKAYFCYNISVILRKGSKNHDTVQKHF